MTSNQTEAEINGLQRPHPAWKNYFLRWLYADIVIDLVQIFGAMLRVAMTGADPASPMIVIKVMSVFLALLTAGRPRTSVKTGRG
jgi:hypothetical protein